MSNCNPVNTPVAIGMKLSKDGDRGFVDSTFCKSLVGSLRYLTITRPDIVYGVGLVSRYMETPKESHWLAVKRILRYIKGSLNLGLFYSYGETSELIGGEVTKMRGKAPQAMFSILGQLHFLGPPGSKEYWPCLHVKQNMWWLHLCSLKLFGCGTF